MKELLDAMRNGDIKLIEQVLPFDAVRNGDIKLIEQVLPLDAEQESVNLLLTTAIRSNQLAVVKYFYKNYPKCALYRDGNGFTPILIAAEYGHISIFEYISETHPDSIDDRTNEQSTVFIIAAAFGQLNMVKYLLSKKPSRIHDRNFYNKTALHIATGLNKLDVLKYLLKMRPNYITEKSNSGVTALLLAAAHGATNVVEYLLTRPDVDILESALSYDALILSARNAHIPTVTLLLAQGAHIDLRSINGTAREILNSDLTSNRLALPLLVAAEKLIEIANRDSKDSKELTETLNTLGEGVNGRRVIDGCSALHIAILNSNRTVVEGILQQAARVDLPNKGKKTAFDLAKNSTDSFIRNLVKIAHLQQLCTKIEKLKLESAAEDAASSTSLSPEVSSAEGKEIKEARDIKTSDPRQISEMTEDLELTLKILIESINEMKEGKEILQLKLGLMLAKPATPSFNPVTAYTILSKIESENPDVIKKANKAMYELLIQRHVVFQTAADTSESAPLDSSEFKIRIEQGSTDTIETEKCRLLRLEKSIHCLFYSNSEEEGNLGKLMSDFIFDSDSLFGISGITGRGVEAFVALMKRTREIYTYTKMIKRNLVQVTSEKSQLELENAELRARLALAETAPKESSPLVQFTSRGSSSSTSSTTSNRGGDVSLQRQMNTLP